MKTSTVILSCCMVLAPPALALATTLPDSCGKPEAALDVQTQKNPAAPVNSQPGKSTLVFVQRNSACLGCSVVRVGLDGAWAGANKGNSYFSVAVEPGDHHVCAWWDAPLARMESRIGLTDLESAPNRTYYFEVVVAKYGDSGAPFMKLKALSPDMGAFLASRSSLSIATPKTK
jgi:hypothetical protein